MDSWRGYTPNNNRQTIERVFKKQLFLFTILAKHKIGRASCLAKIDDLS